MNFIALLATLAAFYGLGLWLLFNGWRTGQSAGQFVLGVFPAALLFLTLPVPFAGLELIQGFQRIGEGDAGVGPVAPFCLAIVRASRSGAAGFLIAIGTAAVLQVFTSYADHRSQRKAEHPDSRGALWRRATVVASTLFAVPVALLSHATNNIPRLVMRVAVPDNLATGETVEQLSEWIAGQSLMALVAGTMLAVIVGIFAIASFVAARSGMALESLTQYSQAVLVIACVWALWNVWQLTVDINAFQLAVR